MKHLRQYLLIVAYVILVAIVAFESFYINDQFDDSHSNQCDIAEVQAKLAIVNMALIAEPGDRDAAIKVVNSAIQALNATCDTNVPEVEKKEP